MLIAPALVFFDQFRRDMLRSVDDQLLREAAIWQQVMTDGEPDADGVRLTLTLPR